MTSQEIRAALALIVEQLEIYAEADRKNGGQDGDLHETLKQARRLKPAYEELVEALQNLVVVADKSIPADAGLSNSELIEAENAISAASRLLYDAEHAYDTGPMDITE